MRDKILVAVEIAVGKLATVEQDRDRPPSVAGDRQLMLQLRRYVGRRSFAPILGEAGTLNLDDARAAFRADLQAVERSLLPGPRAAAQQHRGGLDRPLGYVAEPMQYQRLYDGSPIGRLALLELLVEAEFIAVQLQR